MKHEATRNAVGALAGFIAFTAISGGTAILTGLDQFPMEWLEGTPFDNYMLPALILLVVVGGTSLAAAAAMFAKHEVGAITSMVAGLVMSGFIVGEVILLNRVEPAPDFMEVFYFALGLILFGLAVDVWMDGRETDNRGVAPLSD